MARVLFLAPVFPPDGVSSAQLMGELAVDLRDAGHDVHVITTRPHYNRDLAAEEEQRLESSWPGLLWRSRFLGIPVIHTRSGARRGGIVSRLGGWASFHLLGFIAALRSVPSPDVVFVPSPLLTIGAIGGIIGRLRSAELIYNVQELYPDLAVEMGMLRNPVLVAVLRRLERHVYDRSARVTVIGRSMEERLLEKGVPREKVQFIPNFVDLDHLRPVPRDNDFSRGYHLRDRFIVSYAGNIGFAQRLDVLLDAAHLLRRDPTILVAIIGDGVAASSLREIAAARRLENVVFIRHQPYETVPEIYAASDLSVVPLLETVTGSALPSKVLRIMACGAPIVAMCAPNSELAEVVRTAGSGEVVGDPSAQTLAELIISLRNDPRRRRRMGEAGRRYVAERYARHVVTGRYARLVEQLAGAREWNDAEGRGSVSP